jgi:hypothetical protein
MRTHYQSGDQVTDHNRLFDYIKDDRGNRCHAENHAKVFKEGMSDELEEHPRSPNEGRTKFACTIGMMRGGSQRPDELVVPGCS